jgi:hypothetical protein
MRFLKIGAFACVAAAAACSSSSNNEVVTVPTDAAAVIEDRVMALEDAVATVVDSGVKEAAAPAAASTFTQVYSNIISPICVTCHNPQGIGFTMGKLDMSTQATAFKDLVGVEAMGISCGGMGTRVVAGNAANSIMFEKIDPGTPAPCGSKMPLGLPPLSAAQANEIESWINAGAKND